ncbi:MAG: tryptophan-rich sensory protein [Candidatus Dependentiae bacterium]|nr:tryptophan-rich sensory protein [Candidatus Dependentiae bacterium]
MNVHYKSYLFLIISIISLITIGSVIGTFSQNSIDTWYTTLHRSPLTPPNYIFGIAWTLLYAMIATSGWLIWQSKSFSTLHLIKMLYMLQLCLNWAWMPLFFTYHKTGTALICLLLLIFLVSLLIVTMYKKINTASLLLIPYLAWLLFAAHLNFYIWCYN